MEFMTLTEKVAYLKGLAEGMELDESVAQNKLMLKIIEVLEDVAVNIEDMGDEQTAIIEEIEAISDDLSDVEEALFEDEDDEDEDEDDYDWSGEEVYDIECPSCGEQITIDGEMLEKGGMSCPKCGEKLEFEVCEDDGCDCGCDCGC